MKKKIIILGTAYPFRGGMAAFNERLAHAFLSEGDDVEIQNFSLQYPNFLFPGKTQYTEGPPPKKLSIESKISSINPITWIKTGLKIKKLKPELLIIGYWIPFMAPCLGTIARIAKKNKHTRAIGILHNIIPHEKRPGDRVFSNYFVKNVDAFISLSKSVLEDLKIFNKNKPRAFCPHPLYDHFGKKHSRHEALTQLNLDTKNKYVLFFGLIRDYKGLDLLIKAFSDTRLSDQKVQLIIAGEFYSNPEKYIRLINDSGVKNSIILHDRFIPDDEVGLYFGAADIVAQPYKNATQSGVTQIGFHFEKPMLVTDVGGLAEIIPHNKAGYVVQPDPKSIADHLVAYFKENKKEEFEKQVILEKKKYEWDTMTKKIKHLLKEINT